jgi:hypothetical protein
MLTMELSGVTELEASAAAVVAVLTAPATAEAGGRLIESDARPRVPLDTGRLLASSSVATTPTGAQLVYAARYAPIVHARQPWLGAAITSTVPQLVAVYADAAVEAWK